MIFFKSRDAARSFGRKVVDNGAGSLPGRRWAVKVL